jgi:hypothetical protein
MREIRQSGSEGGGGESNRLSLPLSDILFSYSLQPGEFQFPPHKDTGTTTAKAGAGPVEGSR